MKKALNLGCGPSYLKSDEVEWINTDLVTDHNFHPDQLWDFLEPIPLPDGSVDFILAWHILEHAALHQRDGMIKDWYRVLKPGGRLAIAVPDILTLFGMYQRNEFSNDPPPWYTLMVNIYGPFNGSIGDTHKWGYNFGELDGVLRKNGFENVLRLNHGNIPDEIREFVMSDPPLVTFADWAAQALCQK